MGPHSHSHVHRHRRSIELGFTPETFPEGTHICYLYSDDAEQQRFMSRYLLSGIGQQEAVTYLADTEPERLHVAAERLGVVDARVPPGQLDLRTALETYCPDGRFDQDRMLAELRDKYLATPPGCIGARLASETTWALRGLPGSEQLVEYESRINLLLKKYPLTTLCQYDTRKFSGQVIFELLNVHPIMIVHGQIMVNPFYVPPDPAAELTLPAPYGG